MRKRGRKSAAELAVAPVVTVEPRATAPDELTEHEARIWDAIIASMPGDWFRAETHPLLIQYCRHSVAAWRISLLIQQTEEDEDGFDETRWLRLQRAQVQQSGALAALATKMRLSQQSRYGARAAATATQYTGPKPWERAFLENKQEDGA